MSEELREITPEPLNHIDEPATPRKRPWLRKAASVLLQIQKYLAYGFLAFYGIHVTLTVVLPGLGVLPSVAQDFFEMGRNVYMGPMEPLFVGIPAVLHLSSGILLRGIRMATQKPRPQRETDIIIRDGNRDDIGLGGLGTVVGLGYKKLWISSRFPGLTPLAVSGYVLAAALAFHYWKMRWLPALVDGDSSLVTLAYVTHYLRGHVVGHVTSAFHAFMLLALLWGSFYHIVSGLFKYRRQLSLAAKKKAYAIIAVLTLLSAISVFRIRSWDLQTGFLAKAFARYLFA